MLPIQTTSRRRFPLPNASHHFPCMVATMPLECVYLWNTSPYHILLERIKHITGLGSKPIYSYYLKFKFLFSPCPFRHFSIFFPGDFAQCHGAAWHLGQPRAHDVRPGHRCSTLQGGRQVETRGGHGRVRHGGQQPAECLGEWLWEGRFHWDLEKTARSWWVLRCFKMSPLRFG